MSNDAEKEAKNQAKESLVRMQDFDVSKGFTPFPRTVKLSINCPV